MIKIRSVTIEQLNSIFPDFGTVLFEFFKQKSPNPRAVMLFPEGVTEFFQASYISPLFKQLMELLVHTLNHQQFSACQITVE